jgi:hypothetical protein
MSTPTRRAVLGCCARAESGQYAADAMPPSVMMNSRRRIGPPEKRFLDDGKPSTEQPMQRRTAAP